MIVITGAAGFIGSVIVERFNDNKFENLILVDDFSNTNKNRNLAEKKYEKKVHRDDFFHWFDDNHKDVDFVIHIGARTDTTEFNIDLLNVLNLDYTKQMWLRCSDFQVPLIYASSAATYGMGEYGYMDNHDVIYNLKAS
jgi:ADP-L-glycero-D-manno-heptose 6-epimerase